MLRLFSWFVVVLATIGLVSAQPLPYNNTFAKEMLHFSGAAYCPSTTIMDWSCSFCGEISNFVPVGTSVNTTTDLLAFVGYKNDTNSIIVAFRGTRLLSILDWLEDLDFFAKPGICEGCMVHEGFMKDYFSIRAETIRLVQLLITKFPSAEIVITGHSLGGALTYIASVDFALNAGIRADTIYTFGSPRVGNDVFRNTWLSLFNQSTAYRVTHGLDPVPHVPPSSWGFVHPRTEVYWDGLNTNYHICDGSGEDPHCADQWLLPVGVTDHVTYLGLDFLKEWSRCIN